LFANVATHYCFYNLFCHCDKYHGRAGRVTVTEVLLLLFSLLQLLLLLLLLLLQYSAINTPLTPARREFRVYYLGVDNSRGVLVTQFCHRQRQWTWLLHRPRPGLVPVCQHHLWCVRAAQVFESSSS